MASVIAAAGLLYPLIGILLLAGFQGFLLAFAIWRAVLVRFSRTPPPAPPIPPYWPRYTIMAALYREAVILPQLVQRLSLIDYPRDALECFLLLEADDHETIEVARGLRLPDWMRVVVVPAGSPQTKPRALNYGLAMATGQFLTIYDAEDSPDPNQLKEAASRFMAEDRSLACLQAPLRIQRKHRAVVPSHILDRQFAAEYASLFEVVLPGMARLGLPFPLGGTSNHFRVDVLREVGGWDAYNVTEDAELGFRLWRHSYRLSTLSSPTWETPPGPFRLWLPQRTRWLKGYLQTLAVHLFQKGLGPRGTFAMCVSLIAGLVAASIHGFALAAVSTIALLGIMAFKMPDLTPVATAVLLTGYMSSWITAKIGTKRIGLSYSLWDMAIAPLYWGLLTLAFFHALVRLVVQPHMWDKTPHLPDIPVHDLETPLTTRRYSNAHAGREAV
ncbi:glycosyltransferase [uncultured Brevundimonas sp.]|uniref:glycosyltransferase n=1 Tax=uncultured Brevundimonas sp. TaxID=213418 RepID=UPI00262BD065|nr:glycosyltransferase [uncultured Brevundimonas sp.]